MRRLLLKLRTVAQSPGRRALIPVLFLVFVTATFAVPAPAHALLCSPLDIIGTDGIPCAAGKAAGAVGSAAAWVVEKGVIVIGWVFLEVATLLLHISASLLNDSLYYGVTQFATYFGSSSGIQAGWTVLRDVGNILLIFSFVFIGLATILGLENYGVKKALPRLLLFAVLLNFSLFAASVVIDMSNLLSTSVYAATEGCSGDSGQCLNIGLASVVADKLGVGTAFNIDGIRHLMTGNTSQTLVAIIMVTLFVTITAITFLAAATLLIIRSIVLVFILVTAPVGFAAMVIPSLQKYAKQWWSTLFSQSFFAPVYLVLILISLKVAESFVNAGGSVGSNGLMSAIVTGSSTSIQVFMDFAIIIGFMLAALMSAKKLGAYGAAFAVKQASFAPKMVGGFAWRNSIGLGSHVAKGAYDRTVGRWQPSTRLGRGMKSIYMNTADAAIGSTLKAGTEASVFGTASYVKARKAVEERKAETNLAAQKARDAREMGDEVRADDAAKEAYEAARKKGDTAGMEAAQKSMTEAQKKMAQILQKMSLGQIKETDYVKKGAHGIELLARSMSPERFAQFMGDKEIPENQKNAVRNERFKDVQEMMDNPDALRKRLKQVNIKDVENMDPAMLTDKRLVDAMGESLAEDVLKSSNIAAPLKDDIRAKRDARFNVAGTDDERSAKIAQLVGSGFTEKQLGNLDPDLYFKRDANNKILKAADGSVQVDQAMFDNISPQVVVEMGKAGKLRPEHRAAMMKWMKDPKGKNADKFKTRLAQDAFFAQDWGGSAQYQYTTPQPQPQPQQAPQAGQRQGGYRPPGGVPPRNRPV
ncbi:hypothetical protein KGQ55_03090 [Patescibacteria group bacterium]|nr:hypothetical protein [Patescibacteria group bacterium]